MFEFAWKGTRAGSWSTDSVADSRTGTDVRFWRGGRACLAQGDGPTVVVWGAMTARVAEAAQSHAGRVEVLDLRTIVPWDKSRVLESVKRTGKCLVPDARMPYNMALMNAVVPQAADIAEKIQSMLFF